MYAKLQISIRRSNLPVPLMPCPPPAGAAPFSLPGTSGASVYGGAIYELVLVVSFVPFPKSQIAVIGPGEVATISKFFSKISRCMYPVAWNVRSPCKVSRKSFNFKGKATVVHGNVEKSVSANSVRMWSFSGCLPQGRTGPCSQALLYMCTRPVECRHTHQGKLLGREQATLPL